MVDPYFTKCKNDKKSKVAHNGWIGGHNCMDDFGYVGWHYLRRTINIWGDCIRFEFKIIASQFEVKRRPPRKGKRFEAIGWQKGYRRAGLTRCK